jgi:hypothetical protein
MLTLNNKDHKDPIYLYFICLTNGVHLIFIYLGESDMAAQF